jgi:hypothetical protein
VFRGTSEDFEVSEENRIASRIAVTHYIAHEPKGPKDFYYRVIAVRVAKPCAPSEEPAKPKSFSAARKAALVVRATSTVACPGGAPGDCIRIDEQIISHVKSLVKATDLWNYFEEADPTEADILFDIEVKDGASISLNVRDADSNGVLYSEGRQVVALDNDVDRIIAHFLVNVPTKTTEEKKAFEKRRICSIDAARYEAAKANVEAKWIDYSWKINHVDAATMDECKEHWKDFVCLAHGEGSYAVNWNESKDEVFRKLTLENDEITEMRLHLQAMQSSLTESGCSIP